MFEPSPTGDGRPRRFTRDLMGHMERDLSTKLDWTAIAHWNTEHPQVLHILILCTADDG